MYMGTSYNKIIFCLKDSLCSCTPSDRMEAYRSVLLTKELLTVRCVM